jgi:hypothetical protein
MMEVSHFHLFSVPVIVLILSHLLYGTPASTRTRLGLTIVTYAGAALELAAPWAVRYLAAGFAVLLLAGWVLLACGMLGMIGISLLSVWGWHKLLMEPETGGEPEE